MRELVTKVKLIYYRRMGGEVREGRKKGRREQHLAKRRGNGKIEKGNERKRRMRIEGRIGMAWERKAEKQ
jgi:hypothetical protein